MSAFPSPRPTPVGKRQLEAMLAKKLAACRRLAVDAAVKACPQGMPPCRVRPAPLAPTAEKSPLAESWETACVLEFYLKQLAKA